MKCMKWICFSQIRRERERERAQLQSIQVLFQNHLLTLALKERDMKREGKKLGEREKERNTTLVN
mgnify:CR=1 FL=1